MKHAKYTKAHAAVRVVRVVRGRFSGDTPDVERLALEHEHGLIVYVAAARDRTGGGLAFADENHRPLALFLLLVEMILAVLQLRDAQRDRLRPFARELLHVLQLLRVRHLRDDRLGDLSVALEKVQQLLAPMVNGQSRQIAFKLLP